MLWLFQRLLNCPSQGWKHPVAILSSPACLCWAPLLSRPKGCSSPWRRSSVQPGLSASAAGIHQQGFYCQPSLLSLRIPLGERGCLCVLCTSPFLKVLTVVRGQHSCDTEAATDEEGPLQPLKENLSHKKRTPDVWGLLSPNCARLESKTSSPPE